MKKMLFCTLCLFFSATLHSAQDLLIFPEIRGVSVNNNASTPSDIIATVDFFGTARYKNTLLLVDIFITEDSFEAERLQIGYKFTPLTTAWLGRMHNILGYWNAQYNHGTYLQTSISRPQIVEFEHNGGLFPSHTTGVQFDTTYNISIDGSIDFAFIAGTSPELRVADDDNNLSGLVLHAREIFNPAKGTHKLNLAARMIYRPTIGTDNQLGAFASQAEIAANDNHVDTINLSIAGIFASWQFQSLDIYGSIFYTADSVQLGNIKNTGSFSSGYIQLDYMLADNWTIFGRLENTYDTSNDPYLELMQNYSPETEVGGVRWDITHNQAIKFEISQKLIAGETFTTTLLNWSAVFP